MLILKLSITVYKYKNLPLVLNNFGQIQRLPIANTITVYNISKLTNLIFICITILQQYRVGNASRVNTIIAADSKVSISPGNRETFRNHTGYRCHIVFSMFACPTPHFVVIANRFPSFYPTFIECIKYSRSHRCNFSECRYLNFNTVLLKTGNAHLNHTNLVPYEVLNIT